MTSLIIGFLDFIASLLNMLLPNLSSSGIGEISSAVAYMAKVISVANYLIPVDTIFTVTGLVMGYKLVMLLIWLVNWVVRTVRG